ncbi:hypothetical protein ASC59_02060 [Leifsonia sp. Root1293]|nr:hypothetical protein ASC59_02060 [Leifsonia sp. Root1293]KRA10945.1 hypothetical protein ASD61_02060 [Leifsonia sp. Root60]
MIERNPRLRVDAIAEESWRLCDRGVAENDARCLLAYLERVENGYELMWMAPVPGVCQWFESFGDAIRTVSRRMPSPTADSIATV